MMVGIYVQITMVISKRQMYLILSHYQYSFRWSTILLTIIIGNLTVYQMNGIAAL